MHFIEKKFEPWLQTQYGCRVMMKMDSELEVVKGAQRTGGLRCAQGCFRLTLMFERRLIEFWAESISSVTIQSYREDVAHAGGFFHLLQFQQQKKGEFGNGMRTCKGAPVASSTLAGHLPV